MAGMMTGLLLLLLAGVTESRVVDLQKRVFGGETCEDTDRRYHVKLIPRNGKKDSLCGGSLISRDWILTAAHCVPDGWTVTAVLNEHPDPTKAVPVKAQPFPRTDDQKRFHDIMLLKLDVPAINFPTVNLPDCGKRPRLVQIAGIGDKRVYKDNIKRNSKLAKTLQCASTTVVSCPSSKVLRNNRVCSRDYEHLICYQSKEVDATGGDSGEGVVFNGMIYGVHSASSPKACASPGKAMDVCEYRDWITEVTRLTFP
ncbi:trypsin-5-like [Eleginops maclovinus]|uniref:trypsin-5-like n=1 Tax=Eleginops maclovinus TaxID=56733 RepID=UPI0030802364